MRYQMKKWIWRILLAVGVFSMSGCSTSSITDTKIVLTTGFDKDEVFRIDTISCTEPEILVYLVNTQNEYEEIYGQEIWDTTIDGVLLQNRLKESVLAKIAQIKTMTLLAKNHGIELDDEETETVSLAAKEYYSSLNETEIETMGITQETIENLYSEYALANKVYEDIIKDINPEISDDEARTITVEQIFLKTYYIDSNGEETPFDDAEKEMVRENAEAIYEKLQDGEDFDDLMGQYNEGDQDTLSFRKNEMEEAYEEVAFNLGTDEISQVTELSNGYVILKCVSTFNREETDNNKVTILEERKTEAFNQEYDSFVLTLQKNLNQDLWDEITLIHDPEVTTKSFFEVYDRYFIVD